MRVRSITREVGTAFAVLAIYVLTLLLPLHQAAGLQHDLARFGFETIGSWSVCEEFAPADKGDRQAPLAVKCPASGITKYEFAGLAPTAIAFELPGTEELLQDSPAHVLLRSGQRDHVGQSRAPPVSRS